MGLRNGATLANNLVTLVLSTFNSWKPLGNGVDNSPEDERATQASVQSLFQVAQGLPIDVTAYGAVGDFDPTTGTGTDDTAAALRALAAVPQAGGQVYFPTTPGGGRYRLRSSLSLLTANRPITLLGAGNGEQQNGAPPGGGSVLVWDGAVGAPIVDVGGGETTVCIRNLGFDNVGVGAAAATHAVRVSNSSQCQLDNVLIFPKVAISVAGVELGSLTADASKAQLRNVYARNCAVGVHVQNTIQANLFGYTSIDCGVCLLLGSPTTNAFNTNVFGGTFEARNGQQGVKVQRAQGANFYGCQYDAWNAGNYGFLIENTATLAEAINLYGGRFTGNTVAHAAKINFAAANLAMHGVLFEGCTAAGILNAANRILRLYDCEELNAVPVVDSVTVGDVRMYGNDVAPTGKVQDRIGGAVGCCFPGQIQVGSGGPVITSGAGSPEGVVTAVVGSIYMRTNGGAGTTIYKKESGAGNTGWTTVA